MAQYFHLDGARLLQALAATFAGRPLPTDDTPLSLTTAFYGNTTQAQRWRAFLTKRARRGGPADFGAVGLLIQLFLTPPWHALSRGHPFTAAWPPGGPWHTVTNDRRTPDA